MNIHIETIGRGPDLVLLHGWGLDSGVFEPLRGKLAQRYRLHLVDLPGYGRSRDVEPPDTSEALAAALVKQTPAGAFWLGWSLGAQIALLAAQRSPGHVRRLVLVAATPCFVARADWPTAMAPDVFNDFSSGLLQDWRATLSRFLGLIAADPLRDREMLQGLRAAVLSRGEPATAALAAGLEWLRHNDLRPSLAAIRQDTLLFQGDRDRLVPAPASAALAAMVPKARICLVAGAGHAPFLSHPERFLSRLGTFLAEAA